MKRAEELDGGSKAARLRMHPAFSKEKYGIPQGLPSGQPVFKVWKRLRHPAKPKPKTTCSNIAILLGAMGLPSVRWPDGKEMTPRIDLCEKNRGATFLKAGELEKARNEMGKAYCRWISYTRLMDSTYHAQSFRSVSIAPDWKYADAAALKEYTDLGGKGIPECENLFTLSIEETTNGFIALNPSGGVYEKGTLLTLTASPKCGYIFEGWAGDLTGGYEVLSEECDIRCFVRDSGSGADAMVTNWPFNPTPPRVSDPAGLPRVSRCDCLNQARHPSHR